MKKIYIIMLTFCLILGNAMAVCAEENTTDRVIDEGQVMTDWEEAELAQTIEAMVEKYQIDIVVATEERKSSSSIQNEADLMFDDRGYGIGSTRDGILFLVSTGDREWAISTSGNAIELFSDYDLSSIGGAAASDYFSEGCYADGFEDYLDRLDRKLDTELAQAQQGTGGSTYGRETREVVEETAEETAEEIPRSVAYVIPSAIIGLVIAAIYMFNMKRQMNTVHVQNNASAYQKDNAKAQIRKEDIFLTSTISKRRIEKNDNQNTHGASRNRTTVHRSSNGNRHGGARGKF